MKARASLTMFLWVGCDQALAWLVMAQMQRPAARRAKVFIGSARE